MSEPKYKGGDRVIVLDGSEIENYSANWGELMARCVGHEYVIDHHEMFHGTIGYRLHGERWLFDERGLYLVEPLDEVLTFDDDELINYGNALKEMYTVQK